MWEYMNVDGYVLIRRMVVGMSRLGLASEANLNRMDIKVRLKQETDRIAWDWVDKKKAKN